jgi:catecholate siderophore receptor
MNNARVSTGNGTSQNVGKKTVKGVEFGASGALTSNWQVFGGITFLDAKIDDNGYTNIGTTAAPVWVVSPFNGNWFPSTPKKAGSIWTSYTFANRVTVGGGANYVSKVYGNVNNNKYVPGYTRFDAMASYEVDKHISLQLNVQNLGDKVYFDKVGSPHWVGVAPGRSASLTANFRY